jgi:EAL domain-containing protein (putative c-di-GMP-specific phosphodiesterase class I)
MCINVSPREIDTPEVTAELGRMLAAHDLPPDRLVLEFAESGIEDGERLAEQVGALRSVGVRTALDDFGAGPESLTHLRRVPIDMVKIGESFFGTSLAGGGGGGPDPAMPPVDVIVGVGRRLGVDVVAQGLEAPEQLAVVRTAGCRLGQGRLFAHPQPAERTEAYISTFRRRPAWPEQRGPAGDGLARTIR